VKHRIAETQLKMLEKGVVDSGLLKMSLKRVGLKEFDNKLIRS
jgi:hypothetical protein